MEESAALQNVYYTKIKEKRLSEIVSAKSSHKNSWDITNGSGCLLLYAKIIQNAGDFSRLVLICCKA